MEPTLKIDGIEVFGPVSREAGQILSPEAISFIGGLARQFEKQRRELLSRRKDIQADIDGGKFPDFLPQTRHIRDGDWKIAPVPNDLQDRRVEITGPVDRKMVINALNSGASGYMADFEDSHSPTWEATIQGQINLKDAVEGTIAFVSQEGKAYRLGDKVATLFVRPRGWHMVEKHVHVDGQPVSAGIFDFGLYFFHNAKALIRNGTGPYFYLPKIENHREAGLWNQIFVRAQEQLNIPVGTIKATVLVETILAAFELDEILYELRDHVAGLNCGRWDYIFNFIKKFKNIPDYIFPDRSQITMTRHCMHAYSLLVIQTCHRRGAHAIGGMAAQIPIKNDPRRNEAALNEVRQDKIREVSDGHDGTWVAHPGLVRLAREEFDKAMPAPNQIDRLRRDVTITARDLLELPKGTITEDGLRTNISIGVQYMASWLNGNGCVPLYNLMEDAATAEISRTQVWQWVHHPKGILTDGRNVTLELFREIMAQEMDRIKTAVGDEQFAGGRYELAAQLFDDITAQDVLEEFLTLRAYDHLD